MKNEKSNSGEQIIPGRADSDLLNEHLVRYLYACELCAGKDVLDAGCGVGYGCFRLAEVARRVAGIDNSGTALQIACSEHALPNIEYCQGDCQRLPFRSKSFDVVTSFELIEHLPDPNQFLTEARRILRPSGLLILSTPNRLVYAEHRGGKPNPFHVREYELDEFTLLLKQHFRWVKVLGQVHLPAVGIFAYPTPTKIPSLVAKKAALESAAYFMCICAQRRQKTAEGLIFIPSSGNVLLERERHIRLLSTELAERRAYVAKLQAEFDEKAAWTDQLKAQVESLGHADREQQSYIASLQRELEDKQEQEKRLIEHARWTQEQQSYIASLQRELEDKQGQEKRLITLEQDLSAKQARIGELTWLWQVGTARKRRLYLSLLAPLDWGVGTLLLLTEAFNRVVRWIAPKRAPSFPTPDTNRCSIIVLSWEGKDLLAESLPSLLEAVRRHGGDHEVIVVDNGSTDGTSHYVQTHFPQVRLVQSERNIYYTGGNNLGVQAATRDIVVLLNNDMSVHSNFLDPLLTGFNQPDVFAVSSQVFFADPSKRREETGKTRARFNGCDLDWSHDPILPSDESRGYVPVFWAHGGAAAFDRRKFLWLGGLDRLYDPFYLEDTDLSYRAWKLGWRCLLAVRSNVLHKHRATNNPRYGRGFIAQVMRRNHYLFLWRNVTNINRLLRHFLSSTKRRIDRAGIPGVGIHFEAIAYLHALQKLPFVILRRFREGRLLIRTDTEVSELISTPPKEAITNSEIDFRRGAFQEYLGDGWYSLEADQNGGYRWMSLRADLWLRSVTSKDQTLNIEGYLPPLALYKKKRSQLSISLGSKRCDFALAEGKFQHSWHINGLEPNAVQKVELTVNQPLRETSDSRVLGVIIRRVGFPALTNGNSNKVSQFKNAVAESSATDFVVRGRTRRILFISAFPPAPNTHAGGQRVFRMIQGLSQFYDINLLTFLDEEKDCQRLSSVQTYCREVTTVLRVRSPERIDPWGITPRSLEVEYSSPEMREKIREAAESDRYDLLQFEWLQMSHSLPQRACVPMTLTHHEIQSFALERQLRLLPWYSPRRFLELRDWMQMLHYELTHLPRFDQVIVLSEADRSYLRRFAPHLPLAVNHMGVDCSYFQPLDQQEEAYTLVFVGYFKHTPNLDAAYWLINRIFPRIVSRFPQSRLYLVGNAPPPELQARVDGLNIQVTGWVPDIREYLARCSVFVAPLRLGAGMRGKVLEAWAMGRPVVCTSIACAGILAEPGKNLLVADEENMFAEHICRLLSDAELRRRVGLAGRETARAHYDWDKQVQAQKALYETILI